MPRDYKLYLEDMLDSATWGSAIACGQPLERFYTDRMFRDSVVLNLEIIGEAAKHIPTALQLRHAEVDWRRIAGLRDRVAHEYFGLHMETLKDTVDAHIAPLIQQLQVMLASLGGDC